MSETPQHASVAQALVAEPNSLLVISGAAANVTDGKFLLCDKVRTRIAGAEIGEPQLSWICISIRGNGMPSAALLYSGRDAIVTGRVKEYRGNRYFEAEKIELG